MTSENKKSDRYYENQIIGNFLYALGAAIQRIKGPHDSSGLISLNQQNPLDGPLSDVFLSFPGLIRIIEFKTEYGDKNKDNIKARKIKYAIKNNEDLLYISKEIHWILESRTPEHNELLYDAKPYIELTDSDDNEPGRQLETFETFVENIAQKSTSEAHDQEFKSLCQQYIDLLFDLMTTKSTGVSGFICMIDKDGYLSFSRIDDLLDLSPDNKQGLDLENQELTNEYKTPNDRSESEYDDDGPSL